MSKAKVKHIRARADSILDSVFLPALRYVTCGDTHSLCVVWERSSHSQLFRELIVLLPAENTLLPPGTLRGVCPCLFKFKFKIYLSHTRLFREY